MRSLDTRRPAPDLALANTLPGSIVPFTAPLFLLLGGYTALYLVLAVVAVIGAILVVRLPELGHEGDPRWALISKESITEEKVH